MTQSSRYPRFAGVLLALGLGSTAVVVTGCGDDPDFGMPFSMAEDCVEGAEHCSCTASRSCEEGLVCKLSVCVRPRKIEPGDTVGSASASAGESDTGEASQGGESGGHEVGEEAGDGGGVDGGADSADSGVADSTSDDEGDLTGGDGDGDTEDAGDDDGAEHCGNGDHDGNESDLDCGGDCQPCANDMKCTEPSDCLSMFCRPSTKICEDPPEKCTNRDDCRGFDDQCNSGYCNMMTGKCFGSPVVDGRDCSDGDPCTMNDACVDGECVPGNSAFMEDFSDPALGWQAKVFAAGRTQSQPLTGDDLQTNGASFWQIAAAQSSDCGHNNADGVFAGDDPGHDHSPGGDGFLAGVVVGGCHERPSAPDWDCLVSPIIDVDALGATAQLKLWRHLHTPLYSHNGYGVHNLIVAIDGALDLDTLDVDDIDAVYARAQEIAAERARDGQKPKLDELVAVDGVTLLFRGFEEDEIDTDVVNDTTWFSMVHYVNQLMYPKARFAICYNRVAPAASDFAGWSVDDIVVGPAKCAPF